MGFTIDAGGKDSVFPLLVVIPNVGFSENHQAVPLLVDILKKSHSIKTMVCLGFKHDYRHLQLTV